jgi:hypothetical protein
MTLVPAAMRTFIVRKKILPRVYSFRAHAIFPIHIASAFAEFDQGVTIETSGNFLSISIASAGVLSYP